MPQIEVKTRDGKKQTIDAELNKSLMEVIRDNDYHELEAICGGCCSCATCHVYIEPEFNDQLNPISEDEIILLEGSEHYIANRSRLSCQIRVTEAINNLRLSIAPED